MIIELEIKPKAKEADARRFISSSYYAYNLFRVQKCEISVAVVYGSRNEYITTKWQALPPMTKRWKIS